MAERYAVVVARVEKVPGSEKLTVVCYPDGAQLFYNSGPSLIRWVFQNVPADIDNARIEFLGSQPMAKYPKPTTRPVLAKGALGDRQTELESSSGSHLPDLVTTANNKQQGYFFYKVVLSRKGEIVIESDPGGANDPVTPTPWPPG